MFSKVGIAFDKLFSLLPFNGNKTKAGLALKAIVALFPGAGAYLSPDVIDALDVIADALIAIGASHGIIKAKKA